ncbi:Frag1/DRAM/Sfk1, partial [Phakopsora pachyrhizi]
MKFITYGAYVWLPVIATLSWLGTLVGLFLIWLIVDDGKKYGSREATVVFISDVGGAHQELFIPGCVIVFVSYSLTLCAERWLRHVERIPGVLRRRDRFWGIATIITGCLGGFSLMMLSILNTFEHPTVHWSFTLLFILFVGASSVCQTVEIIFLQKGHPDRPHLKRNALLKALIVVIAIAVAIVFGILYISCRGKATSPKCNVIISTAGACEWTVSIILVFYFMTFILDLWPAAKTS